MILLPKFDVVLADPPWRYKNFSDAVHGAAFAHYDGMSVEELSALPVSSWASRDSYLVLWATWPKLDEALQVIGAWGFEYVTGWPWVKTTPSEGTIRRGVGFHAMSASEVLLVARRGMPTRRRDYERGLGGGRRDNVMGLLVGTPRVFYAPIGRHSKKPLEVQDWVEGVFGERRLELFARREREGWTCWGNELGWSLSSRGLERCSRPRHREGLGL